MSVCLSVCLSVCVCVCVCGMQYCADSCDAQAWSASCVLEVLYDLEQMTAKQTSLFLVCLCPQLLFAVPLSLSSMQSTMQCSSSSDFPECCVLARAFCCLNVVLMVTCNIFCNGCMQHQQLHATYSATVACNINSCMQHILQRLYATSTVACNVLCNGCVLYVIARSSGQVLQSVCASFSHVHLQQYVFYFVGHIFLFFLFSLQQDSNSNYCPSVRPCWLGHLTYKTIPNMTYNEFGLTLDPTQSIKPTPVSSRISCLLPESPARIYFSSFRFSLAFSNTFSALTLLCLCFINIYQNRHLGY